MIAFQTTALVLYLARTPLAPSDVRAPDRPSGDHEWLNGTGWVIPADLVARRVAGKVDNAVFFSPLLFELVYRETLQPPPMTRAQLRSLLISIQQVI